MNCFNSDTPKFFLCSIRFFFGIWLLYVGLYKWISIGSGAFVNYIASDFDKTWSPHLLNVFLAWVILIAEPVLAILILIGKQPRIVWSLTSLFLFMLAMGQTMLLKPDVIGNWQYLVLAVVCAALSDPVQQRQTA